MKICVIGGAGYIGSHTVYELIKDGHEVIVIDNLSTGIREMVHKDAKFYYGDITDECSLENIFNIECNIKKIDIVMHFAAKLIVSESLEDPLGYYYNNVEGVRIMLKTMVKFNVKNLVFSSTAAVYGEPINYICEEDDFTIPINPYGESKLTSEMMIKWVTKTHGINYCIFRYFNVAGADKSLKIGLKKDNLTHLIPVTVQTMLNIREKMFVFGDDYDTNDGTCVRDYIHVSDLAIAHILGAKYIIKNKKSLLANLGSNNGYSVKEIINEVQKYGKVNYEIVSRRKGDPAKLIASNKIAKEKLGWEPKFNLESIIKSDIDFRFKSIKK